MGRCFARTPSDTGKVGALKAATKLRLDILGPFSLSASRSKCHQWEDESKLALWIKAILFALNVSPGFPD
jgi:hypothetical protein